MTVTHLFECILIKITFGLQLKWNQVKQSSMQLDLLGLVQGEAVKPTTVTFGATTITTSPPNRCIPTVGSGVVHAAHGLVCGLVYTYTDIFETRLCYQF